MSSSVTCDWLKSLINRTSPTNQTRRPHTAYNNCTTIHVHSSSIYLMLHIQLTRSVWTWAFYINISHFVFETFPETSLINQSIAKASAHNTIQIFTQRECTNKRWHCYQECNVMTRIELQVNQLLYMYTQWQLCPISFKCTVRTFSHPHSTHARGIMTVSHSDKTQGPSIQPNTQHRHEHHSDRHMNS